MRPPFNQPPSYWWEFSDSAIVVESDDDRFPAVGRFAFGEGGAEAAIALAEQLIRDLKEGRKNPRQCAAEL